MQMMREPMLAHVYDPSKDVNGSKVYDLQPKYDGFRCIIAKIDGVLQLYSRNLKPLDVPHILEQAEYLESIGFDFDSWALDGELYCHGESFQTIQSWIKRANHPDQPSINFICYDLMPQTFSIHLGFRARFCLLDEIFCPINTPNMCCSATYMDTESFNIETFMDTLTEAGYEGVMLRNKNGVYKNGRSRDLLKHKRFLEEDFRISFTCEGQGRNAGTAIFTCEVPQEDGSYRLFTVTAPGDYKQKAQFYVDRDKMIGKILSVKYQEKTDSGIPRFPIALGIKEDR